ncbi:MAG: tRNA epoxyqueuosine(34) reductase QueG [Verrucomicrobiales bacterium]|nr:tRNA epoxyqueuosine(34) reductase QueG [Verrucomicrobiales bacterium]
MKSEDLIKARADELGFNDCRITSADAPKHVAEFRAWLKENRHGEMAYLERNAAKRVNPELVLPEARSIITLATNYARGESSPTDSTSGAIARYARSADYHEVLMEPLRTLNNYVTGLGPAGTRSLWYVDTGPLLERDLAQRAGLGFAGKHTNLISRRLGNWFFISEIITTLQLETDTPEHNRCGNCTRCIAACPTRAITGPFQLDARRCISYLTIELKGSIPVELRPLLGNRIYGCDDCLAVCPWNRFARAASILKARNDLQAPVLLDLLKLDDAGFKRQFAGTPIVRTKRRGLLRNVCVALGNAGGINALPELERASLDREPLIAEHARWAMAAIEGRSKMAISPRHPQEL